MLTSLFGDPGPPSGPGDKKSNPDPTSTPVADETVASGFDVQGQTGERTGHDLFVTGSAAQALRDHFAATHTDQTTPNSLITLLDPAGMWAPAVIKALSDAGGRPIERLHLREHPTLRTLAQIERTTLIRRHEDTLRICYADVRTPGLEHADIPVVLMERSQMTTVIIGSLQPAAIDAWLEVLVKAATLPTWRCTNLLFMLPLNAGWIANRIGAVVWPARLNVHLLSEAMSGAASVWNAMLSLWNQVKVQPGLELPAVTPMMSTHKPAVGLGERDPAATVDPYVTLPAGPAGPAGALTPIVMRMNHSVLDPARARQALTSMLALDGLLGCAVVDANTGLALAHQVRNDKPVDMEMAAAACAQMLRAHRLAARNLGLPEPIDEVMTTAGARQHVMRPITRHPDMFVVALLEKQSNNLALARFQLIQVERNLT